MTVPAPSGHGEVFELLAGYRQAQAVSLMARLGLADQLAAGRMDVSSLARACQVHSGALRLLLRVLSALGLVAEEEEEYALTPRGACLISDRPGSLSDWAFLLAEAQYRAWGDSSHAIRTGKAAFDNVFQRSFWQLLSERPELGSRFTRVMAEMADHTVAGALVSSKFPWNGHLTDVGGGSGEVVAALLTANSGLRATIFDGESASTAAMQVITRSGLSDRCDIMTGNFFDGVPAGSDLYLLCRVLSDWDDYHAARILATCRAAMHKHAKLLVVTNLPAANPDLKSAIVDLSMLILTGGWNRGIDAYIALLGQHGLEVCNVRSLGSSGLVMLEAQVSGSK